MELTLILQVLYRLICSTDDITYLATEKGPAVLPVLMEVIKQYGYFQLTNFLEVLVSTNAEAVADYMKREMNNFTREQAVVVASVFSKATVNEKRSDATHIGDIVAPLAEKHLMNDDVRSNLHHFAYYDYDAYEVKIPTKTRIAAIDALEKIAITALRTKEGTEDERTEALNDTKKTLEDVLDLATPIIDWSIRKRTKQALRRIKDVKEGKATSAKPTTVDRQAKTMAPPERRAGLSAVSGPKPKVRRKVDFGNATIAAAGAGVAVYGPFMNAPAPVKTVATIAGAAVALWMLTDVVKTPNNEPKK